MPLICPGTQKLHTFRSISRWLELFAIAFANRLYASSGTSPASPAPQKSTLTASNPQAAKRSASC